MYQAAHHELVASARAVKLGHEINPDFQIGCMISMVPIYPFSCRPADMVLSVREMHMRYFFSDIHCRGHYPAYAKKLLERKGYEIRMEPEDEKILAEKQNKELVSNISHDLKTPITAIKGYVEGIMDGVADTPRKNRQIHQDHL